MLVKKYQDSHCKDKELLVTISRAVSASPELRSKKTLIETFISKINEVDDVITEWHDYVNKRREKELSRTASRAFKHQKGHRNRQRQGRRR